MSSSGSSLVRLEDLEQRAVARALWVMQAVDRSILAVDAVDGALVCLEGLPAMPDPQLLGLSADGTRLLLAATMTPVTEYRRFSMQVPEEPQPWLDVPGILAGDPTARLGPDGTLTFRGAISRMPDLRLCLLDMPTGEARWFDLQGLPANASPAALSPDGGTIAVVSSWEDDDENWAAGLDLIDVGSGTRRRLWTSPTAVWSSWESSLSWSPDGRRLAATLFWFDDDSDDDWETAIVFDAASGELLHRADFYAQIAWPSAAEIFLSHGCEPDQVLNVETGTMTPLTLSWQDGQSSGGIISATDGRIIAVRGFNNAPSHYFHTDTAGSDAHPLLTSQIRFSAMYAADRPGLLWSLFES